MTREYVLTTQDRTNGRELYLLVQGTFFHAYNQCAVLFHEATGYEVRMVDFRGHNIERLGIPYSVIDGALARFESRFLSAKVEKIDSHYRITISQEDADSVPYEHNIIEDFSRSNTERKRKQKQDSPTPRVSCDSSQDLIRSRLSSIDIGNTTPLQALTILSDLKSLL